MYLHLVVENIRKNITIRHRAQDASYTHTHFHNGHTTHTHTPRTQRPSIVRVSEHCKKGVFPYFFLLDSSLSIHCRILCYYEWCVKRVKHQRVCIINNLLASVVSTTFPKEVCPQSETSVLYAAIFLKTVQLLPALCGHAWPLLCLLL